MTTNNEQLANFAEFSIQAVKEQGAEIQKLKLEIHDYQQIISEQKDEIYYYQKRVTAQQGTIKRQKVEIAELRLRLQETCSR